MGRTVRDLAVNGRSEGDVWGAVLEWVRTNGGWSVTGPGPGPYGTHAVFQMGAGIAQGARFFEVTARPFAGGVSVHTEGYVKGLGEEMDFNPSSMMGGLPRREGWRMINDLWSRLAWLSAQGPPIPPASAAGSPVVAPAPAPPAGVGTPANFCRNCGTALPPAAGFCPRCGHRVGT